MSYRTVAPFATVAAAAAVLGTMCVSTDALAQKAGDRAGGVSHVTANRGTVNRGTVNRRQYCRIPLPKEKCPADQRCGYFPYPSNC